LETTRVARQDKPDKSDKPTKTERAEKADKVEKKAKTPILSKRASAIQPTLEKINSQQSKTLKKSELLRLQRLQEMKGKSSTQAKKSSEATKQRRMIIVKEMNGITLKRRIHAKRTAAADGEHKDEFVWVQVSLDA